MTENKYVIDASMGVRQGMLYLSPARLDEEGDFVPDTSKPRILCDMVEDREIVGIFHEDGAEALDAFCNEHRDTIRKVFAQFL